MMAEGSAGAEDRFADLVDALGSEDGVTRPEAAGSPRFGSTALKINGSIFAMLTRGRLVVKLPRDRVRQLIDAGAGGPFEASQGRPMKEWVVVLNDDSSTWMGLAKEALRFVGGPGGQA